MLRRRSLIAFGGFVALFIESADAALPKNQTRTIQSANGKYLLVLLSPDTREIADSRWNDPATEEGDRERRRVRRIEKQYSQSGLYRNDGSSDLLWPIDYITVSKDIYVADDGVHLVLAYLAWNGSEGTASDRGNALEFYARGQPLSVFNEDQLLVGYVARLRFSRLIDDGWPNTAWPTCTSSQFDTQAQTFEITTNWGDMFRFDIMTGALVASKTAWPIKAAFVLLLTLITVTGWWLSRRVSRVRRAA